MGVQFLKDPATGAAHFVPFCCVCGTYASFGEGVQLRHAMRLSRKELAGTWRCYRHWKEKQDGQTSAV